LIERPGGGALAAEMCGDLLLVFSGENPTSARQREVPWIAEARTDSWTLCRQDVGQAWKGFPMRTFSAPGWRLWLLGEVFGLLGERSLEAEVLAAADGRKPAGNLNGHFLLLGWNETAREWHVLTDRFGSIHAYFAFDGQRAAIGTFSPAVAASASRRRVDWVGLTGFFSFGFFPEDRTFFEDVRIVRPATRRVFDASGRPLREERTWTWRHEPDGGRCYDETVEQFGEVLGNVLTEHAAGCQLAVPISGGLDSRTTVAALTGGKNATSDPGSLWAYSYGYSDNSVEMHIAKRVAAVRNLPLEALTIGPYLFERLHEILPCIEGFQDITQCRQAVVVPRLAERTDRVVAAHWGDVWLDDMGLLGVTTSGADSVIAHSLKKIRKSGGAWLTRNVCARHLEDGSDVEALLEELVRREFDRLPAIEDPDFRVKAFKTEQWSFRWTLASLRVFQAGAFPRLPFYDNRIADFFSTVPSEFVAGRRLQIDYLKRFAPDLACITWQARDADLYWATRPDVLLLPRRAMKKLVRLATGQHVIERNWEVQFLSESGRAGLERWLLAPGLKLHDLVSRPEVVELLADFFRAPFETGRGYTVSMLLTFSAWLEMYG
jgi:asparagine synthase (glutamine-hydrolysing)